METTEDDPLVADEAIADDQDSSLGHDAESSTQSITSSILDYRRENGRTYHGYKDGKYAFPNDETENDRLDLQHTLFLRTFDDKLGLAPPNHSGSEVQRVLDIGTGTGIWAMDYADEHPEAEVIGIDLSPVQPNFVPPNVQFLIDDMEEDWPYSDPFNYIHSRMMNSSVSSWPALSRKIFENLAPGGYAELQEIGVFVSSDDGTLKEDSYLAQWARHLDEAATKLGRIYLPPGKLKEILTGAGFVDVVETRFKWPSNAWPKDKKLKELGLWNNENFHSVLEAGSLAPFTRALGWTTEEVITFLASVRKELNDPEIHAYWPIYAVYGRKPV